jgi:DNA-binding transcriptional regulator YiaG
MMPNQSLIEFRNERRLSRADFGAALDVTEVTVWRWETGKRKPRGDNLKRICELTGLSAAVVLGIEQAPPLANEGAE